MSHPLTRREMLCLLLGSTMATAACRSRPPRPIPGRVIGGRLDRGHQVGRLGELPDSAPKRSVPILVVGSGIAGLSAAWRLQRRGEPRFLVLELESQPGGTSTYGKEGIIAHPWGAHYLPVPAPHHESLCALLSEMGVVQAGPDGDVVGVESCLVRDPEERLFVAGEWVEGLEPTPFITPADRREMTQFRQLVGKWAAWRDSRGRRAFDLPLSRCSDDAEVTSLDKISALDWLRMLGFSSRPLRWMLEYACRDDYGTGLHSTSAWALLFYHAARVRPPLQQSAPFLTWPEGNGKIVRHLEHVAGERLQCDRTVVDVQPLEDRVRVTVLDATSNRCEAIEAERVILATPSFVVPHLVRPFRERPPAHYEAFSYSPWLVGNLHLKSRPRSRGFPLAWDNVVYAGASLGYVVATHQTLEDDGPTIWTYYQPMIDSDLKLARTRLAAADQVSAWDALVAELSPAHPNLVECSTRLDVWHFGHAMIRPVPGFVTGQARRKASEPFRRIHFAHTDLSGVALLDEAHFHGVRAADEVLFAMRNADR